jgi:hypothetical protein
MICIWDHEYAEKSLITVKAGINWFDFENKGRTSHAYWDAAITQRFPTITVTYETGVRYVIDPLRSQRKEDRYLATVRRDGERTSLAVSGGIIEYREAEIKHLENSTYRLTGTIGHAITIKSKITVDVGTERFKDYLSSASADRYLTGIRFEHLAKENLTLAMDYRFTNVYSRDDYSMNYYNNRFAVELRKTF